MNNLHTSNIYNCFYKHFLMNLCILHWTFIKYFLKLNTINILGFFNGKASKSDNRLTFFKLLIVCFFRTKESQKRRRVRPVRQLRRRSRRFNSTCGVVQQSPQQQRQIVLPVDPVKQQRPRRSNVPRLGLSQSTAQQQQQQLLLSRQLQLLWGDH